MGFRMTENTTFIAPVTANVPRADKIVPVHFMAEFDLIDDDALQPLLSLGSRELVDRVLRKWYELKDVNGAPVEYTGENRADALKMPFMSSAMMTAFLEGLSGRSRKN